MDLLSPVPKANTPAPETKEKDIAAGRTAAKNSSAVSRMQSKVTLAFGVALACIAAVAGLQYQTVRRLNEDNRRVSRHQSVLWQLNTVQSGLNRADASMQSFVATGQQGYLAPYNQAIADLKQHLQELDRLTGDNSIQDDRFAELDRLANESLLALQSEADARKKGQLSAATLLPLEASIRKSNGSMRALSSGMEAEEFRALREWREQAQTANHQTNLLIWVGCLVACVLLASAGIGLFADLAERGKAEASRAIAYEALQHTNEKLEREVKDRREAQAKLQESERRMRDLSVRVLQLQDEEHRRIGRELHDSVGQYLAALRMALDSAKTALAGKLIENRAQEKLAECVDLLDESIREVRTTSYLLHPPLLEECGLRSAIPSYVEGFSRRSGIQVTVDIAPDFSRLPGDAELALFRVLQESLTNVHRHSGSSTAYIRVLRQEGLAILEISDQGKGIPGDSRANPSPKIGVGLQGMTERMRQLGGDLCMESGTGGTTVRATIPQPFKSMTRAASA
jgi:signal transduction histidine kinase